jgi:hypothetical protein
VAAHEAARSRREGFVTAARLAVAAGIAGAEPQLPKPETQSKDLVPYDEGAQRVLSRAFEVAIAQSSDMVDVRHVVEALNESLPTT